MAFHGWPADAIEFFRGLEANNTKDYWQRHLDVYERVVRRPMVELLTELEPDFGPGRVLRPYRDVRFSTDKSPYKTSITAQLGASSWISLAKDGLGAGAGMYEMAPDQLRRYRHAVADNQAGQALAEIVAAIRESGHWCGAQCALKTAPRGYPKDHPRIELLRGIGLTTWRQYPPGPWLATNKAKARVTAVLRDSEPLTGWLSDHVDRGLGKAAEEALARPRSW